MSRVGGGEGVIAFYHPPAFCVTHHLFYVGRSGVRDDRRDGASKEVVKSPSKKGNRELLG